MGGIFYLSHQSDPAAAPVSYATSVAAHLLVYGGLAMLFCWSLAGVACGRVRESMWVIAGLAFALTVLYGAGDELHQAFVPGRVASELDLAIDAVGALLGVAAWSTYLRFLHGSSRA